MYHTHSTLIILILLTGNSIAIGKDDAVPKHLHPSFYYAHGTLMYGLGSDPKTQKILIAYGTDGKPKVNYGVVGADPNALCRWRLMPDAIWISAMRGGDDGDIRRVPFGDLRYYDKTDPDGRKKLAKEYTGDPEGVVYPHHWAVTPATDVSRARTARRGGLPVPAEDFVNFDILPQRMDSCLLFVQDGSELTVWSGAADKLEPRVANFVVRYRKTEHFDAGFTDQFFVFPHGEDYLFLTAGGQLHLADRSAGGFRTTRPVWRSKTQPIRLVVTDVDSGTVGLFTLPDEDGVKLGQTYFTLSKGQSTQRFISENGGEYPNGVADPKLALELLNKYVRPKK